MPESKITATDFTNSFAYPAPTGNSKHPVDFRCKVLPNNSRVSSHHKTKNIELDTDSNPFKSNNTGISHKFKNAVKICILAIIYGLLFSIIGLTIIYFINNQDMQSRILDPELVRSQFSQLEHAGQDKSAYEKQVALEQIVFYLIQETKWTASKIQSFLNIWQLLTVDQQQTYKNEVWFQLFENKLNRELRSVSEYSVSNNRKIALRKQLLADTIDLLRRVEVSSELDASYEDNTNKNKDLDFIDNAEQDSSKTMLEIAKEIIQKSAQNSGVDSVTESSMENYLFAQRIKNNAKNSGNNADLARAQR